MLHQQIKDGIKEAMKAKDQVKLSVLRGLTSAFTNELVSKKRTPDGLLTDEEAIAVIRRQAKQRQDSISQFTAGGRPELAAGEQAELAIIESYLPKLMPREQIKPLAEAKKAALGLTTKNDVGRLMSELMKDLKGQADGNDVRAIAEELLS